MTKTYGTYPSTRLRRTRKTSWMRDLVRETTLSANDLILPIFVHEESDECIQIASMPGVVRWPLAKLKELLLDVQRLDIKAVALFPVIDPKFKNEDGTSSRDSEGLAARAIRFIKETLPNVGVIADVALDPYTSHGQDGIVRDGDLHNDLTIEALILQAETLARAGCDIVAPSDMMDGRIGAVRKHLDAQGFSHVAVLSYAAKYASSFYGPFRDAVGSSKNLGKADKRTYQMDPGNSDEALREAAMDVEEGADILMVKPALPYLDVVRRVSEGFEMPVFAYQVSGEYASLKAAALNGWLDEKSTVLETLLSCKRAGASAILTYFALDAARWLSEDSSS